MRYTSKNELFMKYTVLFLSLFSASHAMANLVEEVYQYNQGSCWIKENKEEGMLNIVDFSSGRAKNFSYAQLFDGLAYASESALPAGFLPSDYKSYIHCNSTGIKFVLNTVITDDKKSQKHRVCLRFDVLGSEVKLNEMGVLADNETGPCEGNDPYKLLGGIASAEEFEQYVRPVLNELIEAGIVINYEVSQRLLKLNLAKDRLDHIKTVEARLQTLLEKKYLRYLERNAYYLPIGEFIPLEI
jgi:hypothetical protein